MTKKIKTDEDFETLGKHKIRTNSVYPNVVTQEQINVFMQHINQSENSRNRAIISMMFFTGIRISEVLNIKVENINLVEQTIKIIDEKTNREVRIFFYPQEFMEIITEYIQLENINEGLLFKSNKGNRLDRTVINKIFIAYSKDKLIPITPRDLRRNWCKLAASSKMNPSEIASQLGHKSIQSMQYYYKNHTQEKLIEEINDLFKTKK